MALLSIQPWWLQQAAGVAAVTTWLAVLVTTALQLRQRWPQHREWSRKLVHIGTGAVVPLAWLFAIDRWIAIPAAAVITLLAAINHRTRLLPSIEDVGRHSYGTVAYGASITVLLSLYWPSRADAACAGVLVMALGDGLAGVVGAAVPSSSWLLAGQRKSLLGTATMAVVSTAALGGLAIVGPSKPLEVVLAMALVATALEQVAWLGLDNLTVPIVTGWLWASWG